MKKIMLTLATISLLGAGLVLSSSVHAEDTADPPNHMASLVQRIADKFGLNRDEVQTVFDEQRSERQAEMRNRFEQYLAQEVEGGNITEDQKQLILTKREELRQQNTGDMANMTEEQRRTTREEHKQELESWSEENGINTKYLFGAGPGMGEFGGPRGAAHMGN